MLDYANATFEPPAVGEEAAQGRRLCRGSVMEKESDLRKKKNQRATGCDYLYWIFRVEDCEVSELWWRHQVRK